MPKSATSEEKNKKENRVGTTALGHSVRALFVASSIAATILTLNPIPVLATVALAYGNYEYNNRLGKKEKKNVEDEGPSPTNKVLWRVAVTAIGTILGGPIGFGIAAALVATDFLSNGKLTEATNKILNGNIKDGIKDIASAIVVDVPKSLFRGAWNLTKTAWSKTMEAQRMSKRDVVKGKAEETEKGSEKEAERNVGKSTLYVREQGKVENKGGPSIQKIDESTRGFANPNYDFPINDPKVKDSKQGSSSTNKEDLGKHTRQNIEEDAQRDRAGSFGRGSTSH